MTQPFSIRLEGHLTREKLASAFDELPPGIHAAEGEERPTLLVDALSMISYDLDARHAFVQWVRKTQPRKVAVLTKRPMWRMVVGGMALASGIAMEAFEEPIAAGVWLAA